MFNNTRHLLRQAYRAQSEVGWENLTKGRIVQQWELYVDYHLRRNNMSLNKSEWGANFIIALWDHLLHVWTFNNRVFHANTQ
jgi:hypothetical protein